MHTSDPANKKFKDVCEYFPNLAIPTKSSMPSNAQLTFANLSIGKKSLGGSVTTFAPEGSLNLFTSVSINSDIASSMAGDKIRLPIAEVIFRAADGDLVGSKKHRDWAPLNAVLLPSFLTEAEILDRETLI